MPDTFPSMQVGNSSTASIATSAESDLILFNDGKILQKSILSFYFNINLGASTEVDLRYYASFVYKPLTGTGAYTATDWYLIPSKTISGTLSLVADNFLKVASTLSFVDSVATSNNTTIYPAIAAFKVTGKAVGAASGSISIVAMVRDN